MPKLSVQEKIVKLVLPSSVEGDEAWVEMDVSKSTVGEMTNLTGEQYRNKVGLFQVTNRIRNWNYTANGEPVSAENPAIPINADNVMLMDSKDFTYLLNQIGEGTTLSDSEKKD